MAEVKASIDERTGMDTEELRLSDICDVFNEREGLALAGFQTGVFIAPSFVPLHFSKLRNFEQVSTDVVSSGCLLSTFRDFVLKGIDSDNGNGIL